MKMEVGKSALHQSCYVFNTNIMLLLTNCEVHTYVRSVLQNFLHGPNQLVSKSFIDGEGHQGPSHHIFAAKFEALGGTPQIPAILYDK